MRKLWVYFNNNESDLTIDECGIQPYEPSEKYDYSVYQNFVLHYVIDGKGYFEVNGIKYTLTKNMGYIIKNAENVKYYPDEHEPWTTYWVGLSGTKLTTFLQNTTLLSNDVIHYLNNTQAHLIIKHICDTTLANESNLPDEFWYKSQLYLLFDALKKEFSVAKAENSLISGELAEVAYQYINTNYMKNITIDHIANYLAISRSYLYKLFKKKYSFSPQQFLQNRRLTVAASLLLTTTQSVQKISQDVGFVDPLYFSKSFTKYFGINPTAFRKQHDYDSFKPSWEV